MHWQRGDISFIFRGDSDSMITAMDNDAKCYQTVRTQENELEIQDEIDLLMMASILTYFAEFADNFIHFLMFPERYC